MKVLRKQAQDAKKEEVEASLAAKEMTSKQAEKGQKHDNKVFDEEIKSKKVAHEKLQESKSKCEKKMKGVQEKIFKKGKISKETQKEIFIKWQAHNKLEKSAKKTEATHKKSL